MDLVLYQWMVQKLQQNQYGTVYLLPVFGNYSSYFFVCLWKTLGFGLILCRKSVLLKVSWEEDG